ncbi:MAG: ParB/RepB/Spo0J family partition protein [Phycisphaerales bacterium]|nr:ParB/RepB/Spo0J family partition protein [Phycisphaerales bacterium]
MPTAKKRKLGRGLKSMISTPVEVDASPATATSTGDATETLGDVQGGLQFLPVKSITANKWQPRQVFDQEALAALADSIKKAGVMQPVLVRTAPDGYELVAGERRLRAAEMAGLDQIPAVIRDIDDRAAAEWSIIENIQREDLNPIERAEAYQRLQDQFGLTHQEIADQVGLNRSSVTNHIRMTELDEGTKEAVRTGLISGGHAKSLLSVASISERSRLVRLSIAGNWSVRELERRVRRIQDGGSKSTNAKEVNPTRSHLNDLEGQLAEHLGTRVHIQQQGKKAGKGKLVIEYFDLDQFDGLLAKMGFKPS